MCSKNCQNLKKTILSHVFIILSQIELYKVVLVRSEILLVPGKYVSGKTVLEKTVRLFSLSMRFLVLLAKSVSSKKTRSFTVVNNLQPVSKILKLLYKFRGGFRGSGLVTCHPLFSDMTLQSQILVIESLFLTSVSKFIRKYYPTIFIHVLLLL